jgi:hypothetical protein
MPSLRSPVPAVALCAALCVSLAARPAAAQDPQADAAAKLAGDMQTAVTKGVLWLSAQQQPDGSWNYDNKPLQLPAFPMKSGVTGLCALALLKCGVSPDEPVLQKAFAFIHKEGFSWTYEVGCILLALEAKANFDPNRKVIVAPGNPGGATTVERGPAKGKKPRKRGVDPADRKLGERCVKWLIEHQRETGLWRYGAGSDEDVSNAQYAMLGLDAAERMGLTVPRNVYAKVAQRLVDIQFRVLEGDKDKVVESFPVPGADNSYRELKKIEAKLLKEIKRIDKKFAKKEEGERDKAGMDRSDHVQTAERKAAERIMETMEKGKMTPRGWMYFPDGTGMIWQKTVTGSLTSSALASLFICKARLEGTTAWRGDLPRKVAQACRDGAAWLALHFSVSANPGVPLHQLYYLYGLERAGVLGLIHKFGKHDWFDAGARRLVSQQQRSGAWLGSGSTSGVVPDTCFALLFLSRGTTPVVKIPGRVMTGVNR